MDNFCHFLKQSEITISRAVNCVTRFKNFMTSLISLVWWLCCGRVVDGFYFFILNSNPEQVSPRFICIFLRFLLLSKETGNTQRTVRILKGCNTNKKSLSLKNNLFRVFKRVYAECISVHQQMKRRSVLRLHLSPLLPFYVSLWVLPPVPSDGSGDAELWKVFQIYCFKLWVNASSENTSTWCDCCTCDDQMGLSKQN